MFVFPGINYATKGTVYQESMYTEGDGEYFARFAIDGIIDSSFSNTGQAKAGEWWKVDLGRKIIFQFARIYARDSDCGEDLCGMIFTLIIKVVLFS